MFDVASEMENPQSQRTPPSRDQGIATFVLVGFRRKPAADIGGEPVQATKSELTARFALPSQAVRAAVAAVAAATDDRYAAITTGEYGPDTLDSLMERLKAINAVGQPGQVVVSLGTLEMVRTSLSSELEFSDLGTIEVLPGHFERLFLVANEALRSAPARPVIRPDNRRSTTFLGRARELEELRRQLDLSRIVSVTGPSGIGKSALLQRLITEVEGDFTDGATLIDLSQVSQPALLGPMLVRLLNAPKLPGEDHIEALIAYLRPRQTLLVLDNAEHLLAEVRRFVTALSDSCNELALLVGSHRPLRVAGEWRYRLEGMDTPTIAEDWRAIAEYDSVSLFVDRAQMVDPKFRLTPENATAIAAVCLRLDGIPLAIELAAAKTQVLSPRQILDRLDDRFLLLRDADGSRPERQKTLETTVDWGYQHLRPEARTLLRRLAVFQGAITIEQATEVCVDAMLPQDLVLPAFEELVEASMLATSSARGPEKRFTLTETIRLYAHARLKAEKEEGVFALRHRDWCLRFAGEIAAGLSGPFQVEWLDRLDASYEDLRTVIERNVLRGGEGLLAVQMTLAIHQFYLLRHYLAEGLRVVDMVASAKTCQEVPALYRVFNLGVHLADFLGDREASRLYALRSVSFARRSSNPSAIAAARAMLAHRALEVRKYVRARRHYLAAIKVFRAQGNEPFLLRSLVSLSSAEPYLGLLQEAREHLLEAEPLIERAREPVLKAYFHQNIAHIELAENRPLEALANVSRAFPIFVAAQESNGMATCMRNAAYAFEMLALQRIAAQLVGANSNFGARLEKQMRLDEEERFERLVSRLTDALGVERYAFATLEGTEMSPEAITELLEAVHSG
ncbi:ATP-binding protein [Fimbriimonas ginsengisoli]|uniref:Serine/threonine protein kinase n=1 Tax=Fimbriimonas ginsengisoli Gsoil 348 TaxID=661478 RepID=A0A068NP06_FIMGI|nr:AAA family ATPase [Fimbriimonas ginsengisoli]AIE85171.1 serine/threonine protein kinase [Fimbriimonas ginsengisoli Gsoil 348]